MKNAVVTMSCAALMALACWDIARFGDAKTPMPSDADIVTQTRKSYSGPLILGEDLMQFDIDRDVAVSRTTPRRDE